MVDGWWMSDCERLRVIVSKRADVREQKSMSDSVLVLAGWLAVQYSTVRRIQSSLSCWSRCPWDRRWVS